MLEPGELNQRIVILRPSLAPADSYGQHVEQWTADSQPRWAKVTPKISREAMERGGIKISTTYNVLIRWLAGLTSSIRVQWKGRVFDVESVIDPDNGREKLLLVCVEHVTGQQ